MPEGYISVPRGYIPVLEGYILVLGGYIEEKNSVKIVVTIRLHSDARTNKVANAFKGIR